MDPTLDPYTARLFQIESGGDPNAQTGSNRGLGQFGPAEEAQFGINDQNRTDPNAQAAAVQSEAALHTGVLTNALGRPPTPGELYLTHQQGIAGGPALLTADPSTPAWQTIRPYYKSDAIAKQAITGNLPSDSGLRGLDPNAITAGQFTGYWVNKFQRGLPSATVTASAAPGAGAVGGPSTPAAPSPASPPAPGMLSGMLGGQQQNDPNMALLAQRAQQLMQPQEPDVAPLALPMLRSPTAMRLRLAALGR